MTAIYRTILLSALFAVGMGLQHASSAEIGRWSGQHANVTEPATFVATTLTAWQAMVARAGDQLILSTPFDEARQVGIGIFLGRRNTGGHDVQVRSMGPRNESFVIAIDERRPTPQSIVTENLTTPWLILLIDRPDLPISIEPVFRTQN